MDAELAHTNKDFPSDAELRRMSRQDLEQKLVQQESLVARIRQHTDDNLVQRTCSYHLKKLRRLREDQATELARARAVTAAQEQATEVEQIFRGNAQTAQQMQSRMAEMDTRLKQTKKG